ncbi:MAG: LptE family protein [Verrucomicrobiota bacterium]
MPFRSFILAVLAAMTFSGCAGYRLGPSNGEVAGEKTVQIRPFLNQTLEPRLGDAVTAALRRNLQRDGTYRLSSHGQADIVVTGVVLRYNRFELSLLENDALTAQDYRINATVQVTARDTTTGRVLFDKPVTGYTLIRVGSDLNSSERQAIPLLADEIAKNAAAMIVDGSW